MKKYWYYILNLIAVIVGLYIWGSSFYYSGLNVGLLTFVAVCGIVYVGYSVFLLFGNRVKFDWHLMKGNYILKVLALVVYIPFIMTFAYQCKGNEHLPKTLVYEENLYKPDTLAIPVKDTLSLEAMHPLLKALPDIDVSHDTLFVSQSNLPDTLSARQTDPSLFWTVYYHFIDPGNQHMTTTPTGRLWAAVIGILGVFLLNGLLVSAIVGWIDTRKEKWLKGEVKYRRLLKYCPHYVIIGANDMVAGIVKQLFEAMEKTSNQRRSFLPTYILIQTNSDVESFRRELFTGLSEKQQQRVIIYYGNRTSSDDIAELMLKKAKEVYILGEDTRTDDIESYHDTMNMECLRLVSEDVKGVTEFCNDNKEDNRLVCRVMFEYQTTFNIFQVTDIDGEKIKFLPFNYYEMWAQKVLVCQNFDKNPAYLPLENVEGIKADSQSFVHFVVVGMSRIGLSMAIEAAHLAHYPNFETNKKRTRITFIDSSMEQEKHFFMGRFKEMFALARYRDVYKATEDIYNDMDSYPWLDPLVDEKCKSPYQGDYLGTDFVDVEWEFVNGSIENPNVQQYLEDAASNPDAKLTITVCLPENSRAIAAAAYLPDAVYSSQQTLQVLVYQKFNDELLRQISKNNFRYHNKLRAFGMKDQGYDASLVELSEYIGERIDEKYSTYKKSLDDKKEKLCKGKKPAEEQVSVEPEKPASNESTGKSVSAKWWSNKYNIYTMWTKFRCMSDKPESLVQDGFDAEMLPVLGLMEHNRWVVEQLLLRYRPLRKDEQDKAKIDNICSSSAEKDRLKKKEYAHLDICSNKKLREVDIDASDLDQALIEVLPEAYRKYRTSKQK